MFFIGKSTVKSNLKQKFYQKLELMLFFGDRYPVPNKIFNKITDFDTKITKLQRKKWKNYKLNRRSKFTNKDCQPQQQKQNLKQTKKE